MLSLINLGDLDIQEAHLSGWFDPGLSIMTAAKLQISAAMLYMCCMHGQPVCQLMQTLQVAGNTEQATSKAIAAFGTAVRATQLLVTRLDDDKATTNSILR